jgi:hypothetical protein
MKTGTTPPWLVVLVVVVTGAITAVVLTAAGFPRPTAARDRPAMSGAPIIVWGTPIGHADRGACTDCHRVASREGERLPTISPLSPLPHPFRGVCNNCHAIEASRVLSLLPAGAMPNQAGPSRGIGSLVKRWLSSTSDGE